VVDREDAAVALTSLHHPVRILHGRGQRLLT
jgi:hypothetical protein